MAASALAAARNDRGADPDPAARTRTRPRGPGPGRADPDPAARTRTGSDELTIDRSRNGYACGKISDMLN